MNRDRDRDRAGRAGKKQSRGWKGRKTNGRRNSLNEERIKRASKQLFVYPPRKNTPAVDMHKALRRNPHKHKHLSTNTKDEDAKHDNPIDKGIRRTQDQK
jgi:hypothetical protein